MTGRSFAAVTGCVFWLSLAAGCSEDSNVDSGSDGAGASTGSGAGAAAGTPTAGSPPVTIDPGSEPGAGGDSQVPHCGEDQYQAEGRPLALFILLDQSGSMTEYGDRWTPVTTALKSFVTDPGSQTLRAGLQYFPYLAEDDDVKCEIDRYGDPAVPIQVLSDNAAAIETSIDEHYFTHAEFEDENRSGTPTRPAYQGSVEYLKAWLTSHPEHAGVLVLATDGMPTGVCDDNGVDDVAEAIGDATRGAVPIKTYVIGIGVDENLEAMAAAGGTATPPFIVDGSGEHTGEQFLEALQAIRGAAVPCDYSLPTPTSGTLDPALVNVRYAPGTGPESSLFKVEGETGCSGAADEWYYDDPATPQRVVLCPETCSLVSADAAARVDVLLGCTTLVR